MNFQSCVRNNHDPLVAIWGLHPFFPQQANWRQLKLFINKYDVPDDITAQLETLHDEYLDGQGVGGAVGWFCKVTQEIIKKLAFPK